MKNLTLRQLILAANLALMSFMAYTCVYAFRKPFTVAGFEGISVSGISYQTTLIISQVIGYMLSKFAGIRFIAALKRTGRWMTGLILVGTAWLSLLLFALVPDWLGIFCFLVNGFMLGFMWGVIFSYVEGRRTTDFIGSVLAVSFIFAGGFTRSVGKWLMMEYNVPEKWMPFMTGLVFAVPLIILFYFLERIPQPDQSDIMEREERISMSKDDRKKIIAEFGSGLVIIAIIYTMLTVMRDIRDNYMGNMWNELGFQDNAAVFTKSETRITLLILAVMSLIVLIRSSIRAFRLIHLVVIAGFLLSGVSSLFFLEERLQGSVWMQTVGLGLYLAYIPFNAIFFERMIASFRLRGNVGFLIYITDAFGYLGSVLIMLMKESMDIDIQWTVFYSRAVLILSFIGIAGTIYAYVYFNRKYRLKFKQDGQ